jgi:hypothetical protein
MGHEEMVGITGSARMQGDPSLLIFYFYFGSMYHVNAFGLALSVWGRNRKAVKVYL